MQRFKLESSQIFQAIYTFNALFNQVKILDTVRAFLPYKM